MENSFQLKKKFVSYVRGYYFVNIFCDLIEMNIIDQKKLSINLNKLKNKSSRNKAIFALNYLVNLGILNFKNNHYIFTKIGKKHLERSGILQIPFSYRDFISNTEGYILQDKNIICRRTTNVIGSGNVHKRKYFLPTIKKFNFNQYDYVVDLGCGDGTFIETLFKNKFRNIAIASDLSKEAINKSKKRLQSNNNVEYVLSNALDYNKWSKNIKENKKVLVCFWFIIHEISNIEKTKLLSFLKGLRKKKFDILICEINRLNEKKLQKELDTHLMPEYYYFHDISNQKLMSMKEFKNIFRKAKYKEVTKIYFDNIKNSTKEPPTVFVDIFNHSSR